MLVRRSVIALVLALGVMCDTVDNKVEDCDLSDALKKEIASYAPVVQKIINTAVNGTFKGITYNELALFVDKFGNRISGSQNLENAIDYMINKSVAYGLDNVHGEEVKVPHWVRGSESATLVEPRNKSMYILGLGNSVGTPPEGILAEVLVVKSFNDLKEKAASVVK
jgi:carboxypeptidase Q